MVKKGIALLQSQSDVEKINTLYNIRDLKSVRYRDPKVHRISRLKSNMILNWDGIEGALKEWPLYEGESVFIENVC